MKKFLNNLDQEILLSDEQGNVKFCNEKLCRSLGYELKEIQEIHLTKIVEEAGNIIKSLKEIHTHEGDFDTYLYNKEGEKASYLLRVSKGQWMGESVYFIISIPQVCTGQYGLVEGIEGEVGEIAGYFLHMLKAEGVGVWLYDGKNKLRAEFLGGLSKQINEYRKEITLTEKAIEAIRIKNHYQGIHKIEELRILPERQKLSAAGIRYVGVHKMVSDGEFLGFIIQLYKEAVPITLSAKREMISAYKHITVIAKQRRLVDEFAEEARRRKAVEEELQHFLDTATDIMTVTDQRGNLKRVSDSFCELVGLERKEVIGKQSSEFLYPEDCQRLARQISEHNWKETHTICIVNKFKSHTGQDIWLEWGIKYLEGKNVFIGTARNITERLEIQKKKEEEQLKGDFFANVTHEFKTPINIILSTVQLIEQILGEEKELNRQSLLKYMKYIKQNSYRLLRLVNNLIDSNKIEAGYYELQLGNHNIIEVVEEITQSVVEYVSGKGVELIFDTEEEEVILGCDPEKVERIMLNLLSNAVKYVKVEGKIEVNMAVQKDQVNIAVKDNGIGIPEEKIGSIFERFIQVDNELVKKSQGSGIGLALVKALVELHGGTIAAQSKEGEGTVICFTLPINQVEEQRRKAPKDLGGSKIEKCSIEFADIYY